jgi:hypothetical protein
MKQSSRYSVEGELQKLRVCSGSGTKELVRALSVKCCCGCDAGSVQEPRKVKVRRWKPVPKD